MGRALVADGANVALPKQPGRWTVRYAGMRPATAAAGPLRMSGVRMRAELANASAVERGVIRSLGALGGRQDGDAGGGQAGAGADGAYGARVWPGFDDRGEGKRMLEKRRTRGLRCWSCCCL